MTKRLLILAATAVCGVAPCGTEAKAESTGVVPQISRTMVINEVYVGGVNGPHDEFLELRNVSTSHQDLSGMVVRFYDPRCQVTRVIPLVDPAGESWVIPPRQTVLVTGSEFSGTTSTPFVLPAAGMEPEGLLTARAGGAALLRGTTRIDAVAWKTQSPPGAPTCQLEGRPALAPPPQLIGASITRDILGTDTDDNRTDFHIDIATP
ncbi:lamin tail domain-containing protein [Lentzea alba]|uniref:lamin tail domain-containing protein n=1 Tax=Lentzea alba TaxID=2714351 RepID=UPI0039BF00DF